MWQMHTAYINTEGILDFLFLRTRGNLGLSICVHYRGESWTVHGAHWNLGLSVWVHCVRGNAGIPRL